MTGGRWASRILAAAAVLLALVGVFVIYAAFRGQAPAPPPPEASSFSAADEEPLLARAPRSGSVQREERRDGGPATDKPEELDYSAPERISIPSLDVRSDLVDLGLDDNGAMETPVPVTQAGWFRPSPPPGVPGATVIAGHVTWDQEPSVFFELGSLEPGDEVEVERQDGVVTVFEVYRIGSFPKDSFPTSAVYDQPQQSELRLITCGGEYDYDANRYLDNVIVWARIAAIRT